MQIGSDPSDVKLVFRKVCKSLWCLPPFPHLSLDVSINHMSVHVNMRPSMFFFVCCHLQTPEDNDYNRPVATDNRV